MSKAYFFMDTTPVDHTLATDKRDAWMPKGQVPYFDKSARQTFSSRTEKRRWLRMNGMRETGSLYGKTPQLGRGRPKSPPLTQEQLQRRQRIQEQGGAQGLLQRIKEGRGIYV